MNRVGLLSERLTYSRPIAEVQTPPRFISILNRALKVDENPEKPLMKSREPYQPCCDSRDRTQCLKAYDSAHEIMLRTSTCKRPPGSQSNCGPQRLDNGFTKEPATQDERLQHTNRCPSQAARHTFQILSLLGEHIEKSKIENSNRPIRLDML